jgi:cell division protease FtsH
LKFESVTTGASNDIERATALARNMVTQYGMSERFGLMGLATVESKYLEGRAVLNCSDVTAAAVDEEVRRILETSYAEAKRILSENMDAMDVIAEFLIRQETITGKEFMQMFNEVREKRNGGQAAVETELQTEKEAVEDAEEPEAVQTVEGSVSGEAAKAPVSVQTAAAADEMSAKKEEPIAAEEPVKEEPAAVEDSVKEREPAVVEDSVKEREPAAVEDSVNDEDSAPEEVSADDAGVHDDRQEELDEAEEPRRRNTASKGRYSQVSLDDIFGEKK